MTTSPHAMIRKQPRGFVALISAIIISTLLLGLATAIGQSTFFSRFDVLNAEYKRVSLGLSEACVNAALAKIGNNFNYTVSTDPAYSSARGGAVVTIGTTYGIPTDCLIYPLTYVDNGGKRTFTISTMGSFLGAFSKSAVTAIAQNPSMAPVVPPPTCSLTASPSSVPLGQSVTLLWSTSANAVAPFVIDHGVGNVALSGPPWSSITPLSVGTFTYTGTVSNAGGSNTCTATISVTAPPPAPSCADSVMVFDRTGSMASSDLANERAAGSALVTLYSAVTALPKLGAGSFGGLDGSAASIPASGLLTSVYSNITSALSSITGSNSSVGSNLGAAISVADTELNGVRHTAGKQKVLIFVSDGLPNQPSTVTGQTGTTSPSADVQNGSGDLWTTPSNAYTSGGGDASDSLQHRHRFYNFNLPTIPAGSTISGILAAVDAWSTIAPATLQTTLVPTGVSSYDQWTANTGKRTTAVGTNDGDSSYIDTSASVETFAFPGAGVPTGSTITSVTVAAVARGTGSGVPLQIVAENGGAPNVGTTNTLTTSYATYTRAMATNPLTGSAWTLAEVNAWTTRFGVRTTSGISAARVTQLYVTVTYLPAGDTGYKPVTATHNPNTWNNANRAFLSDNSYATSNTNGNQQGYSYSSSGLSVPASATITGVEVQVEAKSSDASGCQIGAELSSNGSAFTSSGTNTGVNGSDNIYTLGGSASLWGRTWVPSDFNSSNFTVRLQDIHGFGCASGAILSVDQVQTRVYYTLPTASTVSSPSAIGGYDQWTANSGTDVNAVFSNDSDTTYLDTSANTESYTLPGAGVPVGATINSVTVQAVARGTAAGANLAFTVDNGGAPNVGTTNTLTTSYATYTRAMATNPLTGSAWTLAEVNAWTTHFGVRTINGAANTRVTQLQVIVTYTTSPISSGCQLGVDLSWNGGSSWTTEKVITIGGTNATYSLGSQSDAWSGHTWSTSDFTNANFRVRVHDINPGGSCQAGALAHLDWLRLKVYYSQPADPSGFASSAASNAKSNGDNIFTIHFGSVSGQNFLASLASPSSLASSNISSIVRTSNVVTVTTSAVHHFVANERIIISGVTNTSFNGTFMVSGVPNGTSFTFAQTASNANSTGGTVAHTNLFIAPASSAMVGIFQSIGSQICPAAAPACSNTIDDDGDGLIDEADPGCHTDGNASNPASYDPSDSDEWTTPAIPPAPPPPPPPPNISIGAWQEVP